MMGRGRKGTNANDPMPHGICLEHCSRKIVMICWRRKYNEPCAHYMKKAVEIAGEAITIKENRIIAQLKSDLTGEDTFDSIGGDISKEEFLENEIFFELND